MNIAYKIQGQYYHKYSIRNYGTIKKRISYRVRMTPNLVKWLCKNKRKKLMRTLIFGRMVVQKEKIYERGPYVLVE